MPCSSCGDQRHCQDCSLCRLCDNNGHKDCEESTEYHCIQCNKRERPCRECGMCKEHEECLTHEELITGFEKKYGKEMVEKCIKIIENDLTSIELACLIDMAYEFCGA